jgi:hypothetical protein
LINPNDQLERLRRALEAVSGDLDAIERRPHLSLVWRRKVEQGSHGIDDLVDHFAFALKRGRLT